MVIHLRMLLVHFMILMSLEFLMNKKQQSYVRLFDTDPR